jgi:formylglycine-generating enzyme required for sulfatase activity
LAADQLLATGRSAELWSLLAELCAPYVAGEDNARAALLAMAVINTLPAGTLPGTPVSTVVTAAARLLADVKHVPLPAQRLTAGDALVRLGDPRPGVTIRAGLPDIAWCEIPEFDSQGRRQFLFNDGERDTPHPGLPPFWVAKYPITYAQFQAFVDTPDGYPNREWRAGLAEYFGDTGTRWEQRWPIANRPRENVSWSEAVAFCRWLTAQARLHLDLLPDDAARAVLARGGSIRLPTEQEWVKAARGFDDRLYPWGGQEYREGFANVDETKDKTGPHNLQETSPVGLYPHAASPFGAEEMSGCVWEYCLNKYADPADLDLAGDDRRAVRGGSWYSNPDRASVAARGDGVGNLVDNDGFRVVCAASPSL